MPRGNEFTREEILAVVDMRGMGLSWQEIGRQMGRSHEGVRRAYMRNVDSKGRAVPEGTGRPGPTKDVVGEVVDELETNGSTSLTEISKSGEPKAFSLDEMREFAKVPEGFIATAHEVTTWPVTMKVKRSFEGKCPSCGDARRTLADEVHEHRMWRTETRWKHLVGPHLKEACLDWCRDNVSPQEPSAWAPRPAPLAPGRFVVSWGLWDVHLGMYAYGKETGNDYDVNIAFNRCVNSVDDMAEELSLYDIDEIWMPLGNDFMHFDNVRQRTTKAMHDLDADSRWARSYRAGTKIQIYMVQRAAQLARKVRVFYIGGNHDRLTAYFLTCMLHQRFIDWPNIEVDVNENPQKIMRHEGVAVLYDHGSEVKPGQYPIVFHEQVLADAKKNGLSRDLTYKEVQVGHTHQKRVREYESETPTNGVKVVTNPALCNLDFYHHSTMLIGEPMKSVEARRYDATGVRGVHVVYARDDQVEI